MINATAYSFPSRDRVLVLRSLMPMVREGASTTWVHVAFEGEWKGHRDGAFEFTPSTFKQIVRNFERSPNPVPMDYEHSIEFATHAPASGWVQKLEVRQGNDGRAHLWAFCELTDKAAEHVRAGEYRFCSGVFDFGATDLVTGEEIGCAMDSLALVNSPFIRGQQPIRLSQRAGKRALGAKHMTFTKEALLAALDQIDSDELSHEQLMAAADFAAAKDADPAEAAESEAPMADGMEEEEQPAPMADPPAGEDDDEEELPLSEGAADAGPATAAGEAVEAAESEAVGEEPASAEAGVLESALESAGLDMASLLAALQENADAFKQLVSGALDTPAAPAPLSDASGDQAILLSVERGKSTALSAQVKTLSDKLKRFEEAEAETLVGQLVSGGRLLPADKPEWKALCLSDRKRFDRLAKTLSQVVPMGEHAGKSTPAPKQTGDVIEIDESHPYVKRTRASLSRIGVKDPEAQNTKIREGLRALSARANAQ